MSQLADDLRAARDYMLVHGWYQGGLEGPDGSVCMVGACSEAVPFARGLDTWLALSRVLPLGVTVPNFNDAPGRTEDEVFDLFDAAIKAAEES